MKTTKKVVALLVLISMIVSIMALTGCGKKNDNLEKELENSVQSLVDSIDASAMVGKYELIEMTADGENYGKEELDALKSFGMTITLELKEDGTGVMDIYGQQTELTYDSKSMTIDGDKMSFTKSEDIITLEKDNEKMVFKKTE